jgi:hypothetical protein
MYKESYRFEYPSISLKNIKSNGGELSMQNSMIEEPSSKKRVLESIRKEKIEQAEAAINKEDYKAAITLLEEISLICLDLDDVDLSIEFSEQARCMKERFGVQGQDAVMDAVLKADMNETR